MKALDGVDFRLLPGEVHALMGENGAGKSTLIRCSPGVHPVDTGTIDLDVSPSPSPAAGGAAGRDQHGLPGG
ncbi:ATP-binding cassette domain-containing protein [Nonomuraea dietziae]|uniref:ATP-binding cassette domain-containing protein n=1 Tax=Nonomuraea dietziae TaxID=65515 RepID=UPI0031CEA2A4